MLESTIWDAYMMILNDISLLRIVKLYVPVNQISFYILL